MNQLNTTLASTVGQDWQGLRTVPSGIVVLTDCIASTARAAKSSLSAPMIFDDMEVFAQFMSALFPSSAVLIANVSVMYLHACMEPLITVMPRSLAITASCSTIGHCETRVNNVPPALQDGTQ